MEIDTANISVLNFLSTEEKNSVAQSVYFKIENEFKNKVQRINSLERELEEKNTHYEQRCFELERELEDIQKELEEALGTKSSFEIKLNELKEDSSEKDLELKNANEKVAKLLAQLDQLRSDQEEISARSVSLAANLEAKTKLFEAILEEKEKLEIDFRDSQKSKLEALFLSEEANASQVKIQYKEKNFEKEKEYYVRQIELLTRQLETKTTDLITTKSNHSNTCINLHADLNRVAEELRVIGNENESLKREVKEKTRRIEELIQARGKQMESELALENSYRKELLVKEHLSNKYKDALDDQREQNEELEKAIAELKRLLQETSEKYGALEKAKVKVEEDAQKSLNQRDLLINELKRELENANELLRLSQNKDENMMAEISPSASAAYQLMSKGLTLTQLYDEYLATSQKLLKTESENKRVTRYLEQILKELEEKSPILNKQREDYEKALDTINTLHMQIDNSIEELEKQRMESDDSKRRLNFLGRENAALNKQVKDLSKQVAVLLSQVEAARTGMPPPPLSVLDSFEATNANQVIDQNLLLFRNTTELQEQNLKLLTSLRDLTDKMETSEKGAVQLKTQELEDELENQRKELEELRAARDRLQSAVENVTSQRDMFKTIVNQQGSKRRSLEGGPASGNVSATSADEMERLRLSLEKAEKEIVKLKNEHEDYRKERGKNDHMEKSEWDRAKSLYDKVKVDNVKLLTQAEYNEERLKTLQKNCESYERQVNALTEKNETVRGIVERHEATIESLRENCLKLTNEASHFKMEAATLREERTLLKENEARLKIELDSIRQFQYSLSMVVNNQEDMKNRLEKRDAERQMRYENQVADLTKECCALKAKLELNIDVKEAQVQITSLREQLNSVKQELKSTKSQLQKVEQEHVRERQGQSVVDTRSPGGPRLRMSNPLQSEGVSPRIGSSSYQQKPTTPLSRVLSPLPNTVRELQVQLCEEKARSDSIKKLAEEAQDQIKKLRSIVENQEEQLKEAGEAFKTAQEEIKSLRESLTEAENAAKEFQRKTVEASDREKALKDSTDNQLMSITEDLEERENELEEAQKKLEEIKALEEKARNELRHQANIAEDMQNKYEREVMLHGADLKAMAEIKERLSSFNERLDSVTAAKLKAEETATILQDQCEEREATLKKITDELKLRNQELEKDNKTLLDQLTQLSDKMAAIQTQLSAGEGGANASFSDEDARTSDQLREIVKYLRKEREIAAGKTEIAEAESARLKAQKSSLETRLEHVNHTLAEERKKNQQTIEASGKYAELMRKVHTMDALADSNRLMRQEKDDIRTELDAAKTKLAAIQSQIEPLQESLKLSQNKLDCALTEKKSLEDEKESYKKRTQELVQKLNRARPEDMIKLQQEVNALQKDAEMKDSEINRLKSIHANLQKVHQAAMAHKNQLLSQLQSLREESRKVSEDNKKLIAEKNRLQQQQNSSVEKIQSLEAAAQQSVSTQQIEQLKNREAKNQLMQQFLDVRQKEEGLRKELDSLRKNLEIKDSRLKERDEKIVNSAAKIESLIKQCNQLRKIATKYKLKAESAGSDAGECASGAAAGVEDDADKDSKQGEAFFKKEESEKLLERIEKLSETLRKKDDEIEYMKNQNKDTEVIKIQEELKLKSEELQKTNQSYTEFKEKFQTEWQEISQTLDETNSKRLVCESMISKLEKDKEMMTKKLSMQQKIIENLQKQQAASGSKVSPSVISMEKPSSEPPPTANIKPMAVPAAATLSSPRSQPASQPGLGSRTIPTASIRPMAPTPVSAGQSSSVGVVTPLDTHNSGDGAVSSTVTLPQATVTPTPLAPASTTTQAFPLSLTATVSPTPISHVPIASATSFAAPQVVCVTHRQDEAIDNAGPSTSGTAENILAQAIAMVAPTLDDRSSVIGGKRKLEVSEEDQREDEEESKRVRMQNESLDDDSLDRDEDMGEPSSSSNTSQRKVESEILIVSSDEEDALPPSQSGHEEGDNDERSSPREEGGREAEAEERNEEDRVPSSVPSSSSSQSLPPRPSSEHPSSSRQALPQFQQLPSHYEEGVDDRIVPSTPTLMAPRTLEGIVQGDGISSQVPSQGFVFSSSQASEVAPSNDALAQMAEGGIIDVSRMDLDQLEEGSARGHQVHGMSTLSRSPTDLSTDGNITSSAAEPSMEEITPQRLAEPDSVVQLRRARSEAEGDDEVDCEAGAASRDEHAVSSGGDRAESGGEEEEEDESSRDSEEPSFVEDSDEDGPEEEEDSSSQRATRSMRSRSRGPGPKGARGAAFTPITWEAGAENVVRGARPVGRVSRVLRGSGAGHAQPRPLGARGAGGRGRRSRPLYVARGGHAQ